MIEDLAQPEESPKSLVEIREAVERVHVQDRVSSRLGLRSDRWDYDRLTKIINRDQLDSHALTVLSTYVDFLTSRSQARELVAERLITFENVMSEFLLDKRVRVSGKRGFEIRSGDSLLNETQLSSGEFQLLYLMVAALTTRRTGTVLAIDEPEISMHISWQRKLVRNLIKCASRAAPQIVLATHSPEVATEFSGNMVELSPTLT
jgi:predicted ATPase